VEFVLTLKIVLPKKSGTKSAEPYFRAVGSATFSCIYSVRSI
jgi:hypothetical protein